MILYVERATYINVFHGDFSGGLSVDRLGELIMLSGTWIMRFTGRNWTYYTDLLNGSEKRQIIGMIDKLNGNVPNYRPQDQMRARWNEIIGTSVALD